MSDEEKKIHDLKFELLQQRERIDKLEDKVISLWKEIEILLQISNNLLEYINVTATHVIQLENKEKEKE